jgi:pimeloyl-ACP methyl ester carboxylesterase
VGIRLEQRIGGIVLLIWSVGGGFTLSPWLWRRSGGNDEPRAETSHKVEFIRRPDGSELCVTSYGPIDADPIIFTHGWGLDSNEWFYAKRELRAYRIITWDLPGLGRSTRSTDPDWSLEKLARDLDSVIAFAGSRRVILIGHSIGAMTILTYCKLFPEALGTRVERIVLAHGTYTNPVKTSSKPRLHTALQKPLLEPLCHLMVWLSPAMRVLNWMSYLNGSVHRSTERDSFSGNETRGQLDFITRFYCKAPPDVIARGMLAMFRYDATSTLERISIPVLIVAGDTDSSCTPDASRYMAERIPNATLVILSAAKHCGLFEWHGQFHEALVDFLSTDGRGRPERTPVKDSTSVPSSLP